MSPKDIAPAHRRARGPQAIRRSVLALCAAVAVSAVAACGAPPTGTLHTRAGYTLTSSEVPVSVCPEGDASRFADDEGLLMGAHFALRVECLVSFEALPEGFQLDYLFGENPNLYSPQPGYEFTLVQFSQEPGVEAPFNAEAGELAATLKIGDHAWDFDGEVPAPGEVFLTVAEKDAPVTLEVVDVERTQTMDLRARTRDGLIQALYTGSTAAESEVVEGSVDGSATRGSYEYSFDDWRYQSQFFLSREVFQPGAGWVAEPDRALLTVEFGWLHSANGLEWPLDVNDAFKIADAEGTLTPITSEHVDEDLTDAVWRTFTLTYDVPAASLDYTLSFHPKGPVKWPAEDIDMPISGDKNHELAVSFA
ncbi:hypothetical protein [Glycomyces algeriensis]|uniref:hypothetical protein n=1 Tax=Glycomyces algeriensis TaxID=256037 RepID=UPI0022DA9BEE|nr:hypothetical protein [Glycomyces algeriensis]MDA1365359.1 hypothetical protein [Glycomyces algeriensis]MDR7349577.1 hypothetical protein [Glycomyces algeriensis]